MAPYPSRGVEGPGPATLHQPTFGHGGNARFDEEIRMRSRAVAGADGWLNQAEAVLEQQQEQSLSPSSAPAWDAGEVETVDHLG